MKRMIRKTWICVSVLSMLIGFAACGSQAAPIESTTVPTDTSIPITVIDPNSTEDLDEDIDIVPDGYYATSWLFDMNAEECLTRDVPESWIGQWTTSEQNEYFKIEAQPIYIKEYSSSSREAMKFIKPMVIVQITNLSDSEIMWHWESASADTSTGLMTYMNAYNIVMQPGESYTRILNVTPDSSFAEQTDGQVKYQIESATIGSFVQMTEDPYDQFGDTLTVTVDFTGIEVPEF